MIYPARRAILLTAAGAPVAVAAGLAGGGLWMAGLAWLGVVGLLILVDGALGASARGFELDARGPGPLGAGGGGGAAHFRLAFPGLAPRRVELSAETDPRIKVQPQRLTARLTGREAQVELAVTPVRRGAATLERLWVRWRGPLGLAWNQEVRLLDLAAPVVPDIQAVKAEALRLFARDALHGMKVQLDAGDGSEFHALRDFMPGMDHRAIDWKQSARHGRLVAKERRTERNHTIVLAIDSGRAMCEPLAGAPRVDAAITAALLLAYVGLKAGDRLSLFAFDARPRISTGAVSGVGAFGLLQQQAARIDYAAEETNYTLALSSLAVDLDRRSLVVVFTEFTDPTGATLMVESVGRLLKRHVVLFVVLRDAELEGLARAEPETPADVSRAVAAAALLRERELVLNRLRRMGVQVAEAPSDRIASAVVAAYLDIKRKELL